MPTYEYVCTECTKKYDIFHKVREIEGDVMCPSCGSSKHKRVMSVTAMSMTGMSSYADSSSSCESGSCCGGSCGVN